MKQLLITFSFLLFIFSCNTNDKRIVKTETIKTDLDSIRPVEKAQINITKSFVLGKFDYKKDTALVKVSSRQSTKVIYLQNEVYRTFTEMADSAKIYNIELNIISGTRNFEEQKVIWERKWEKLHELKPLQRSLRILEFSSMPSSSRHHWGTDLDLNSLNNAYFNSGKGLAAYEWLKTHANGFGFYQVYTEKNKIRTGYNLEKWHWSYLPLASKYLEYYNKNISSNDINGFKGYEQAQHLNIIKDYVNGISKKAKAYE